MTSDEAAMLTTAIDPAFGRLAGKWWLLEFIG